MKISIITITATLLFFATLAFAQAKRGTLVHEETIRVAPNADAARLGEAGRGHELVIIETSRDWVHVEAILRVPSQEEGATDEEAEGSGERRQRPLMQK